MNETQPCPDCRYTFPGEPAASDGTCSECCGEGWVECTCSTCGDPHTADCEECGATGRCPRCNGSGQAPVTDAEREAAGQLRAL